MIQFPHTWIELNKQAFNHNAYSYKKIIGPEKQLAAVVKSNAYGHGMAEIAQLCQENEYIDWLCVGTLTEALTIRQRGVSKPILVLYFIDADPVLAFSNDISFMASDYAALQYLNAIAAAHSKSFSVHLKIDTGMSRFGFMPDGIDQLIKQLFSFKNIEITGIYSHLAKAANSDQGFNKQQETKFNNVIKQFEQAGIILTYKHLANSAGITALTSDTCNFFRLGLGLYGWWPSAANKQLTQQKYSNIELQPVLTLKTRIIQLRTIAADQPVGYDNAYITQRPTKIAILPIGYYDGYDRRLSNKGFAMVGSHYVPIIGMIAMTVTMIDVTDCPDVVIGDEVIMLGNYEKITPHFIAESIGSFNPREILTRLNPIIARKII
jgi:alanine racemase